MAYSDRKSQKPISYGRVSYGRTETQAERDAIERSRSKQAYKYVKLQPKPGQHLLGLGNSILDLYKTTHSISRFSKYDWERILELLEPHDKAEVIQLLKQAQAQENQAKQDREVQWQKESDERHARWAEEAEARKQAEYDTKMQIVNSSQLMLGSLQSETSEVFQRRDRYELDMGDELEDPVSSRLRSGGWIDSTNRRAGFKLQLSIALDVSNSNWYNQVAEPAIRAFQELVLAARALKDENPDDVAYSAWLFCQNKDGKGVEQLRDWVEDWDYDTRGYVKKTIDDPLKETRKLFGKEHSIPGFAGEDSYIYPLLQRIAAWERLDVGDGYVKLDIILSDGVFERKVDISTADDIQARRGQVQTVILNFMPEDGWYSGRLPYQCVQYPVTADNVTGILRLVLSSFLEAYI